MENIYVMKKIMKKILAVLLTLSLLLTGCSSNEETVEDQDSITVSYVDVEGETVDEKEIPFDEDDTLVGLMEDNFENVSVEYGMIMTLEDYETPDDWSTFLCIYVDDEMSEVGIEDIELVDGMEVSFVVTEYSYE